tara:strand:+ start:311 stop:574 length:264 start_codon:yes stop_codon:yes gene_type:complete
MVSLANYNMSEDDNKKEESAELIDFTSIKLKQIANDFEALGMYEQADEVLGALAKYQRGEILIKWQKGMPFIIITEDGKPKKPSKDS